MKEAIGLVDVIDLAKYVIWFYNDKDKPITQLKLQKILYYLQRAFLQDADKPLFGERIEAWEYGPVVPCVYYTFCRFGASFLRAKEGYKSLLDKIDDEIRDKINSILHEKENITARQLVQQTHKEYPWKCHEAAVRNGERPVITIDELKV